MTLVSQPLINNAQGAGSKMSSGYDKRTTTFNPDGRLLQVEYAIEHINQDGTVVGILSKEGKSGP